MSKRCRKNNKVRANILGKQKYYYSLKDSDKYKHERLERKIDWNLHALLCWRSSHLVFDRSGLIKNNNSANIDW